MVSLISLVDSENENGFHVETEGEPRENIFANKKDVHSAEFYQASAQGIRLETMFELHSVDYDGEELLTYENTSYQIIRTYDRGEFIELICQSRGVDHGR